MGAFMGLRVASSLASVQLRQCVRAKRRLHQGRDMQMQRVRFLAWASTTLTGHLLLFQLIFAVPMAVLFILLNYSQGTLTPGWAIWIIGLSAAVTIFVTILIWTTITLPRMKGRGVIS
jgi:hypothetical protein